MANPITTLCGVCLCLSLTTFTILMISSFSSLEYTEYGLDYSSISKTVSHTSYLGGIHFLGVGHSFIKFPRAVQTIEFSDHSGASENSLHSRTSDGLEVVLELSFQYKLQYENLYNLYMRFNVDYKRFLERIAIHTLTETATNFTAYSFFMDRANISDAMFKNMNLLFKTSCYADIEFFQLRKVGLPKDFEDALQLTEVKKQDIIKAEAEKNKTVIELETLVKVAELQKNVTVNLAQGEATAILTQNQADTDSFRLVQQTQSASYKKFKEALQLDPPQLLNFIRAKVIRDFNGTHMIVAMTNPDNGTSTHG